MSTDKLIRYAVSDAITAGHPVKDIIRALLDNATSLLDEPDDELEEEE